MFGRRKASSSASTPSLEVKSNAGGRLILRVTGVELSNYSGESDFKSLNALTQNIVVAALQLNSDKVQIIIRDGQINLFGDRINHFTGVVGSLLGIDPLAVKAPRRHPMGSARRAF